ncbi:MAG: hypothetical protein F6K04_15940 [Leptolyngbya sp. SIO4C5]|nr:hypothetical protein [Leptolyngbya sp. SIO4C5]
MSPWKRVCISEVCESIIDCINKTAPKIDEPSPYKMIRTTNIRHGRISLDSVKYVTEEVYRQWTRRQVPKPGDVLLTREAPMGEVGMLLTDDNVFLGQRIVSYRTDPKKLYNKFLLYTFQSKDLRDQIQSFASGSTVQHMRVPDTKALTISLPPIAEQKRIVAILDEAFEGIDGAIANTEKNLANARELFESYLNAIFIRKGDDWVEKKLQEILSVQPRNGWSPPAKNHSDTGIPVLTLSSVTGFQFDKDKVKHTSALTKPDAHYWLKDGEFLITRSNTRELVGHVAICEELTEPTICCDLIMKMQVDPRQADRRFVYWHYRTREMRELISSSAQGANPTMRKINKSIVQNLPVALPKLAIQKELVEKIDAFEAETQRLEAIYQQKLAALNELKQSILQRAFSGELTAEVGDAPVERAGAMEAA